MAWHLELVEALQTLGPHGTQIHGLVAHLRVLEPGVSSLVFYEVYDQRRVAWIELEVGHAEFGDVSKVHILVLHDCRNRNIILTIQKVSTFEPLKLPK